MPKIPKDRAAQNQLRIEAAAIELFTSQGFHGTTNREIANKVGISTGALYIYYPNKEAIFTSLVRRYQTDVEEWLRRTVSAFEDPLSEGDLKQFAWAVWSMMQERPEYLLLIQIDVIEFRNRHFLETFRDVPGQFRRLLGPAFSKVKRKPRWKGHDPAFVLASVYLYFFNYGMVEQHMRGNLHMGVSHERAIAGFISLIANGMWKSKAGPRKTSKETGTRKLALDKIIQDRIDYMRFLSGRLWDSPPDVPPKTSDDSVESATPSMLFLPEIARDRIDASQLRIEKAALDLFTRQGFHGTNIREIAEKAGLSPGAIYTYYTSKEAIFAGLVQSYRSTVRNFFDRVFRSMEDPFSEGDLRMLAAAVRSVAYQDFRFWLLVWVDVIEFKNQHFATVFQDAPGRFSNQMGQALHRVRRQPGWRPNDPAFVLATIYYYFTTYFVIEKQSGTQHLSVSDEEAVERMIDLLSTGLWN